MTSKTIVISINAAWNIVNFRGGLIAALQVRGHRVVALAPPDGFVDQLARMGVEYFPLKMDRKGVSPLADLLLLARYYLVLRRIGPDVLLTYTAKPNIYGSLAARALAIPVAGNVSGLGTVFIAPGILTRIVVKLYALAFRWTKVVFFQNREDLGLFVERAIVRPDQARLLPGSGVNLAHFTPPAAVRKEGEDCVFLFVGRLLWDKGVGEYVAAARLVRREHPAARFQLLGFLDDQNRTAVSRGDLSSWVGEGIIEYLGETDDVRPFVGKADCVVLPSYREGLPRSLLEAAAMAKPLIASDVPGCREVVEDGRNGFLCQVRDAASLASAMDRMVRLTPAERAAMGQEGRSRIERDFSEELVVEEYVAALRGLFPQDF